MCTFKKIQFIHTNRRHHPAPFFHEPYVRRIVIPMVKELDAIYCHCHLFWPVRRPCTMILLEMVLHRPWKKMRKKIEKNTICKNLCFFSLLFTLQFRVTGSFFGTTMSLGCSVIRGVRYCAGIIKKWECKQIPSNSVGSSKSNVFFFLLSPS